MSSSDSDSQNISLSPSLGQCSDAELGSPASAGGCSRPEVGRIFPVFSDPDGPPALTEEDPKSKDARVRASVLSDEHLARICETFALPDDFIVYRCDGSARANSDLRSPNRAVVYLETLKSGMRFPLSAFLVDFLNFFDIPLGQLHPNAFIQIACFEAYCHFLERPLSLDVFSKWFRVQRPGCFQWASVAARLKKKIFTGLPTSVKFESGFFVVEHPSLSLLSGRVWAKVSPPGVPYLSQAEDQLTDLDIDQNRRGGFLKVERLMRLYRDRDGV